MNVIMKQKKRLLWIKFLAVAVLLSVATLAAAGYQFRDYLSSPESDRRLLKQGLQGFPESLNMQAVQRLQTTCCYASSFRFIVFGDSHQDFDMFRRIIEQAMIHKPDFIIHTGDFTNDGRAFEYEKTVEFLKTVPLPVIMAAGNHDMDNYGNRFYARIFGPPNFFFDMGSCRFIFLNNVQRDIVNDLLPIQEASSFSSDLSRGLDLQTLRYIEALICDSSRVFVIMHIPPPLKPFDFYSFTRNGEGFIELMTKYSAHIARVLFGHIHGYGRTEHGNVTYIEAGGAGPVRDINMNRDGIITDANYVLITVTPNSISDEVHFIK